MSDQWFYGIADCNGLESFEHDLKEMAMDLFLEEEEKKKKTSQQFGMCLRAQANQQKHSVVYRVLLPDDSVDEIEKLMGENKNEEALQLLKKSCKETMVGTYGTTKAAAKKNWEMIPNRSLDTTGTA